MINLACLCLSLIHEQCIVGEYERPAVSVGQAEKEYAMDITQGLINMVNCAIFECGSSSKERRVPFYKSARPSLKNIWIHATYRKDFTPTKYYVVVDFTLHYDLGNKDDLPTFNLLRPFLTTASLIKVFIFEYNNINRS